MSEQDRNFILLNCHLLKGFAIKKCKMYSGDSMIASTEVPQDVDSNIEDNKDFIITVIKDHLKWEEKWKKTHRESTLKDEEE